MKIVQFIKESIKELKKVIWPSRKQVLRSTLVVILFSVVLTIFLGGLDFLLVNILKIVLPAK